MNATTAHRRNHQMRLTAQPLEDGTYLIMNSHFKTLATAKDALEAHQMIKELCRPIAGPQLTILDDQETESLFDLTVSS